MSASTVQALLAIKANTRVALATALTERNAECEALRLKLSMLSAQPAATKPVVAKERVLPAHWQAAREHAMRTGKCVRVN